MLCIPDPQFPQFNTNDPATQLTGVATVGTTLFAGYNCFTGDCNLRVRPNVGLNYDPRTGRLAPALAANVQVNTHHLIKAKTGSSNCDNVGSLLTVFSSATVPTKISLYTPALS